MLPINRLLLMSKYFSPERPPNATGMVPVKSLLFNLNSTRERGRFIGMPPVNRLYCKFKFVRPARRTKSEGMVPAMLLVPMLALDRSNVVTQSPVKVTPGQFPRRVEPFHLNNLWPMEPVGRPALARLPVQWLRIDTKASH